MAATRTGPPVRPRVREGDRVLGVPRERVGVSRTERVGVRSPTLSRGRTGAQVRVDLDTKSKQESMGGSLSGLVRTFTNLRLHFHASLASVKV